MDLEDAALEQFIERKAQELAARFASALPRWWLDGEAPEVAARPRLADARGRCGTP